MTRAGPIRDDELAGLFDHSLIPAFALAVSGGADSMALMHLVHRWVKQAALPVLTDDGRARAVVLTVDHGLRPQSRSEAEWVAAEAGKLGLSHEILTWDGEKPASAIQEAAREARYGLMHDFVVRELAGDCNSGSRTIEAPRAIVTAHQQDDQAETLLMRLARGSGIDGLAGMTPTSRAYDLTLLRPLLGVPKARLVATLEAAGQAWIDDPSNENEKFERVRLRHAQESLASIGLTNAQIALSARRLARSRAALDWATMEFAARARLDVHDGAFAALDRDKFCGGPEELRVRLIAWLIASFGGQPGPPRLASVEDLCERLQSASFEGATLGGAMIAAEPMTMVVFREPGREGLPLTTLARGERKIWDHRFCVAVNGTARVAHEIVVGALGAQDYKTVREQIEVSRHVPFRAAITLPAFRKGKRLLAVPHLGFWDPEFPRTSKDGGESCSALFLGTNRAGRGPNSPRWPET